MAKELTTTDVIEMLKKQRGTLTLKAFAATIEAATPRYDRKRKTISEGYLADVLTGRREPGISILKHLDLEKIDSQPMYRRIK